MLSLDRARWVLLAHVVAGLAACGDAASSSSADAGGGQSIPTSTSTTGFDTTASGNTDGCAESARYVYLLDKDRELVRFDPETQRLTSFGLRDCLIRRWKTGDTSSQCTLPGPSLKRDESDCG